MVTFRSFLKFLKKREIKCLDPTSIDLVREKDRQVTFLNQEEIERLFASIPSDSIQDLRDLAILECIYSTGLRISELVALDRNSVNLETREFAVRGK